MSMNVFLPQEGTNVEEISEEFTLESWQEWQTNFQETEGTVKLPKFQIEYETVLNNALKKLGMELACDETKADYPHMIEEEDPHFINEVKQKTFIDVNEEGTEAAGATSVEMRTTSAIIDEDYFYMDVNRPFLFII